MNQSDEPFLKRWSRRKAEAREQPDAGAEIEAPEKSEPAQPKPAEGAEPAPEKRVLTEEDFADVDFAKLDMQSDYSRFMQPGVPDAIKQRALHQLWSSDPVFSAIEPFNEYGGDFTDKAVAVAAGTLQTAYKIGRGFLTDEEVAEWEKLGKPEVPASAVAAPAPVQVGAQPSGAAPAITVRTEHADQADVQALLAEADPEPMRPGAEIFVARRDGAAIACVVLAVGPSGDLAEVTHAHIAQSPSEQRNIARSVLNALEASARESGVARVRLPANSALANSGREGGYRAEADPFWLEKSLAWK